MATHDAAPDRRSVARARELLARADLMVAHAADSGDRSEQLRGLYLGALRGAGAALAVGESGRRHRGSPSAWSRLPRGVPSLGGWSAYFAGLSRLRSEIEVGIVRDVSPEHLAEIHTRVLDFLDEVQHVVDDQAHGSRAASGTRPGADPAEGPIDSSRLAG